MPNVLEILIRGKGGDQASREMKKVSSSAEATGKIFKSLGALLTVGLFAKGIQSSIRAYAVQEKAVTKLNAALRIQNDFTVQNSKALQDQASALQRVTTFGDEQIISAQALLLSYKLTKEEVMKAIPAILDMAAATGKDLRIATDAVGRAIGGQIPLLKTFGVTVDESAFKTEGMTAVLKALEKQFKGQAKALAESGIGPMEQFGNLMGDVQEDIGRNVIPVLNAMIKTYLGLSEALNKPMDLLRESRELLKDSNITIEEHNRLVKLMESNDKAGMEAFKLRVEKRLQGNKEIQESETDTSRIIEEKILKAIEMEKERLAKVIEVEEKAAEERRKTATEISSIQDSVTANMEKNLVDMLLAEKTFGEGVEGIWQDIGRTFLEVLAKQVIEEKAAAGVRIGVEAAVAGAKSIAAYSGIPIVGLALGLAAAAAAKSEIDKYRKLHGGGVVPGLPGEEKVVIAKAGERFTPPGMPGPTVAGVPKIEIHISGTFLEADETKWSKMFREKVYPEMQRYLKKTGESFSGG